MKKKFKVINHSKHLIKNLKAINPIRQQVKKNKKFYIKET